MTGGVGNRRDQAWEGERERGKEKNTGGNDWNMGHLGSEVET